MPQSDELALAQQLASVADEKKATDILILDVRGLHNEIDFFVIATATGTRHAQVLGEEALSFVKKHSSGSPRHVESSDEWTLGDFGGVVLHVFTAEGREFYDLEHLWGDAPQIAVTSTADSVPA